MWYADFRLTLVVAICVVCASGSDTESKKAIQIVETIQSENGTKLLKILDQHSNGPSLQTILLADEVTDKPVLVFSISGKTRGGKSFLLNLMHKFLQANGEPGWEAGVVPRVFPWMDGIDSCTRGLWISPTIHRRKNSNGQEVGILLMDNQGLFDGEITSGEAVAMSGVSTIISFLQMFNMKGAISTNDMEQIMLNLVPEKPEESEQKTKGNSLLFIVRDFVGGKKYGYGLDNGRKYIASEQERGTDEHKSMWQTHRSVFDKIECVLLPHPGIVVMEEDFTTSGNLSLLEAKFISTVDQFFQELFSPTFLIPQKGALTGQMIYNTLKKLDGMAANEKLSYYNMFLDRNNEDLYQKLESSFDQRLKLIRELSQARNLFEETLQQATFKGASAEEFKLKLKERCEDLVNAEVEKDMIEQYYRTLKESNSSKHGASWPSFTSRMNSYLLGDVQKKIQMKNEIIKKAASLYYKMLRSEKESHFKNLCENAQSQQFYDKLTTLNTSSKLKIHAENEIEKCPDFLNSGGNQEELNEILVAEQQVFEKSVHRILLRNMYKVKEYFVNYYFNKIPKNYNVQLNNMYIWPDIKTRINALQFESESERNEIVNYIEKGLTGLIQRLMSKLVIAGIYYSRLSNELLSDYENSWYSYSDQQFLNTFNNYNSQYRIRQLASEIFPEFSDFRRYSYKWAEEKNELAKYLELALYKEYHSRGYRFSSHASFSSSPLLIVMLSSAFMYLIG